MKKWLALLLALCTTASLAACDLTGLQSESESSVDSSSSSSESGEEEKKEFTLSLSNVYNGEIITTATAPKAFNQYMALETESEIAKFLYEYRENAKYEYLGAPEGVTMKWKCTPASLNSYVVKISETQDFQNVIYTTEKIIGTSTTIRNLSFGKYYYKVVDKYGNETPVDSFEIGGGSVRVMDVNSIQNFRDLGGWKTEDGKSLKYGMLYRSAELSDTDGAALAGMGLKWEIDLRAGADYKKSVIPAEYGIGYLQAGIKQGDYVLPSKEFYKDCLTAEQIKDKRHEYAPFEEAFAESLYNAFKLLTDENNYPMIFHCTHGADRTGTFAFLLEGMLGVELDDLYRDFELTSLDAGGTRWRSNIGKDENGNYYFTDDGYVTSSSNYIAIGLLYKGLMADYKTEDGKLSSAIKNYLKQVVGLTDADMEAIANIMLG